MGKPKDSPKPLIQRILDIVERVGNRVPHPVILFLILIAAAIVPATAEGKSKMARVAEPYGSWHLLEIFWGI